MSVVDLADRSQLSQRRNYLLDDLLAQLCVVLRYFENGVIFLGEKTLTGDSPHCCRPGQSKSKYVSAPLLLQRWQPRDCARLAGERQYAGRAHAGGAT
jgi:hypothetical protein